MAKRKGKKTDEQPMFFSAYNYKMIGFAIFLIVGGFTAMYLENEVNGFISLFISPIVIMAGFVLVIFAIMKHDRDEDTSTNTG
ncbi:hypothetical protein ACKGJO_07985 [Gracilimonas sp. Q87]|uniref:hypothetical protein n=1 Tax=Gracilimonas sp. Q87 TaxID=3384766 RepID=UPI0039842C8C